MILRFLGGLSQFVHNVLWCADVGIPHPKVNNILSGVSGLHFNLVNGCKYIRWKSIEPGKSFHKNNLITFIQKSGCKKSNSMV